MVVVTVHERPGTPRLTVVGSGNAGHSPQGIWATVLDGTAATAVGGAVAGGFGIEAVKSVMTGEAAGRW